MDSIQLKDRKLWFDGDSTVEPSVLVDYIKKGKNTEGLFVTEITDDIKQYNKLVSPKDKIKIKKGIDKADIQWQIPEEYLNIDLKKHIFDKLAEEATENSLSDQEVVVRLNRVNTELHKYQELGHEDILRVLIFVINTLRTKKKVWGVGRGSSVSSYILYLIGVHDVDSVLYELDINDFLR